MSLNGTIKNAILFASENAMLSKILFDVCTEKCVYAHNENRLIHVISDALQYTHYHRMGSVFRQ